MGGCGGYPAICQSQMLLYLGLAQVSEQRLVGCIFPLLGSWLALFGFLCRGTVWVSLLDCANSRSAMSL